MAKKKREKKAVNKDAWLTTYGDMITLVLTFFILLYSMSSISSEKYEILVKAFSESGSPKQIVLEDLQQEGEEPPGFKGNKEGIAEEMQPADVNELADLYKYVQSYVDSNGMGEDVEVGEGDGFVIMRFRGDVFFTPDSPILQPAGKDILDFLVAGITPIEQDIKLVRVDGHTATNPNLDTYSISDRKLSSERATAVLMYMEDMNVIDPAKMMSVGYGKHRPIATNDTQEGREENRRVELYILDKETADINIDEIYDALAPKNTEEVE